MIQQTLFAAPSPLRRKFIEFDRENPWVYEALREMALQLKGRGYDRWGIAGLWEALRWRRAMETAGDPFKLNNTLRAAYSRELMRREPMLEGFFATRRSELDEETPCER